MGLRLMLFDETCVGRRGLPGLSRAWWGGARLYQRLGRLDAWTGARSWADGLAWLAQVGDGEPISSIQFWGHGKWGSVLIGNERLDAATLAPSHPHRPALEAIRDRLAPEALWWFRTCETFGADAGHDFARRWTDFFARPAAGHTFIIGHWQSGLHTLPPGHAPFWPADEGLREGTPAAPTRAQRSHPGAYNTITCWHGRIPAGW